MNTQISSASTSLSMSSATVNSIDASVFKNVEFTILPSTTADVATLKPLAVFDKDREIKAIVSAADDLKSEHISYEKQYVEGGRKALYALLSKIYALAIQINSSDYADSILRSLRNELTHRGVKTQTNSNAITMLVKWVVGVNRQTAHNYSKALQAAFHDNISAQELSEYFVKRGGLQAAKSEGKKNSDEKKDQMSELMEHFVFNADRNHELYENTDIKWTEQVFGDGSAKMMMILGTSRGSGNMQGLRAFYLSTDAYKKIRKILSDELFAGRDFNALSKEIDNEAEKRRLAKQKKAA